MTKINYIAVDDEYTFLRELKELLKEYPFLYELDSISDPFEAIDTINNKKPDLVFLDHDMPGINGQDVLKSIKYKTSVVFITSNFSPIQDVINHNGIASINGYLSKPIDKYKLKEICLKINTKNKDSIAFSNKLTVPNGKKEDYYIDISKLSYIQASGKYSDWHFINTPVIKDVNLSLKEVRDLLLDKNIDFKDVNRSFLIFDNGIKMRRNKDIIVSSNNNDVEIGIKDIDGFFSWLKNKFK